MVGLFTGMSILSVFEIIFWGARVAAAIVRGTAAAVNEKNKGAAK